MAAKNRKPKNPLAGVTGSQAYYLMTLLGRKDGFEAFVPEWSGITGDEKASQKAAELLTGAGANRGMAGAAISYLKNSKPKTDAGKAKRRAHGLALLFGEEVLRGVAAFKTAPKKDTVQISAADLAALMERLAKLEAAQEG